MTVRTTRHLVLDVATALLVAATGLILVHDRLLPALAERARVDAGEVIEGSLRFRRLVSGDTVGLADEMPSLILVFKSTCPVCEETAPTWKSVTAFAPQRIFAIGLEADSAAAAWTAEKLAPVEPVRPLDAAAFIDRLRIRAVPTTLLFEGRRLSLARIGPLSQEDLARIRRALQGSRAAALARSLHLEPRRLR